MESITLTVASYNIHKGVGMDGRFDLDRVREVIKELDADIIGLQEVATGCNGRGPHQLAEILRGLDYKTLVGPTFHCRRRGQFGNVLFTRFKVRSFRPIDLSAPRREPRGAIDADLAVHDRTVRVVNTHLGLNIIERHYQVNRLLQALGEIGPAPVILLGDLNEWFPRRRTLAKLVDRFGRTPWARSFPARVPLLALDRIYAGGKAEVRRFEAVRTGHARTASDHLPVRAEVEILPSAIS